MATRSAYGQDTIPFYAYSCNLAWILAYHNGRALDIITRPTHDAVRQCFEIACCLGYIIRESQRLMDDVAPAGAMYLPRDPAIASVLHQFAIALLALPTARPPEPAPVI